MTCYRYNYSDQLKDLVKLYHDMGWFRRQIVNWLISDWGFTEYAAQRFVAEVLG